ncbi:MAG: glycosyltransferase [Caulobacteraceae bacterium]|nr:glycosyltransferase [Caulobacteraceae bacterium]
MRIAQILSTDMMSGAARHCLALTEGLARRGHQVLLICRPGLDVGAAEAAGVRCATSTFKRSRAEFARLLGLMRAEGSQVMHTHMSGAHAFGIFLRFLGGPPVVATAHARHLQLHWAFNDLVIAPSRRTAAYHRWVNLVPPWRMTVIPGFLGAQLPQPPSPERRRIARQRLGLPDEALVIGHVGDVMPEKRQSDLILAARPLLARRPEAKVVMVGAPLHRGELRRMDRAMQGLAGRVVRLERRADVPDILPAFDIFALPSVKEEGPLVALEAMAAGLPVVGARVGQMGRLVAEGESGFLVRPWEPAAMAARLEQLAEDPALRSAMGLAARARALAEVASAATIEEMEAALARAARIKSPSATSAAARAAPAAVE